MLTGTPEEGKGDRTKGEEGRTCREIIPRGGETGTDNFATEGGRRPRRE